MDIIEAKNGDKKARKQFILENIALVKSIAVKYNSDNMFDIDDLISEGCIGVMCAIDRFDVDRGLKFSTFAYYWIKKMIQAYVRRESRSVYIPIYGQTKLDKFGKALMDLSNKLDREPSLEEVASYLEISVNELKILLDCKNKFPSVDALFEANNNIVVKGLYDDSSDNPMDLYEDYEMVYEIRNLVFNSDLSEKQLQVLILKYGLVDGNCMTLESIGEIMGISRQMVSQHELAALKKLRESINFRKLDGYGVLKK
jgi:RNA polymerase nonessential primary-like sigma factor